MSTRGNKAAASAPTDWEDKFWRLKSEYDGLQTHCNKQTEDISMMLRLIFCHECDVYSQILFIGYERKREN